MSTSNFNGAKGASLSQDGVYRHLLWRNRPGIRTWLMGFCMVNPSDADAFIDDPTITRCNGFAEREGSSGIVVANMSPYRTPYPEELFAAQKRGVDVELWEENKKSILAMVEACDKVVLAWGGTAEKNDWIRGLTVRVERLLKEIAGDKIYYLGVTKKLSPKHPLMLRKDTPLLSRNTSMAGLL